VLCADCLQSAQYRPTCAKKQQKRQNANFLLFWWYFLAVLERLQALGLPPQIRATQKIRAQKQTSIQNPADSLAKRPVESIFQSETRHLGGIRNFGWRTAASGLKPLRRRALWIKKTE